MSLTNRAAFVTAVAGAVTAALVGLGPVASADPPPPPPPNSDEAPAWAPRKPAEVWHNLPVVWAWLPAGGHWGVWINGDFLPLD
jgi:hypothetical protein